MRKHMGATDPLTPDDPIYTEAVKALKWYYQARAVGVTGKDLKRLSLDWWR